MFRKISLAVLLCTASMSYAANNAADKLNGILQGITSMQAQFSQQTYDARGQSLHALSGEMQVKRPGFFRWETKTPSPQLIVASGARVSIYDPELEQLTIQKLDTQVGNTPAMLLSGDPKKLDDAFTVSEETGSGGDTVFALRPKAKDALFDTLRVSFKGKELTGMNLKDSLGQKTEIRFTQVKVNPSISNAVFSFQPPKGTDVINETK